MKKEFIGCLSVAIGMVGIFISIAMAMTFYLLPLAFILFIGCLILISAALTSSKGNNKKDKK